ncbi:MAG: SIMPL domain-containing protein [Anaerolineae bacterium]|nr:SIMPL domain-containing protein [Anaerolineae bacterium]
MKTTVSLKRSLLVLLVGSLLAAVVAACTPARAAPPADALAEELIQSPSVSRYVTVIGTGRVTLAPDVARIHVGAEATAESVAVAKADVDAQIDAILVALKAQGVADADIQTSNYSIYYVQEPGMPVLRDEEASASQGGYRVSSTLRVTVRDVDTVGAVLDAVVDAGANQVYGVEFTVDDEGKWQSEARTAAVADAKARAEELAKLSGVELGKVLSVSEVIGGGVSPVMALGVERAVGGAGIAPGELEMSTQIQVTYAIQ